MKTDSTKPTTPCPICHAVSWYWPGDYYLGMKRWLCGVCHPAPKDNKNG